MGAKDCGDMKAMSIAIQRMMEMYNAYIYQGDNSEGSATCKIHLHFHCPENSFHFGVFHNYDAGKGERGLKTWAKAAA